ncbi:hypothetical protein AM228_01010 [Planktothricoides sp. SR001]|nr:hypothetical protein AM228_01010 [Planktothricoides sp. SR001]
MQPVEHREPEPLKHQKPPPAYAILGKSQNYQVKVEKYAQLVVATLQFQEELIQIHFSQKDEWQHSKTQCSFEK